VQECWLRVRVDGMMCPGVECVDVQLQQGLVIVDTILSAVRIQELIEETGRKAVLFGVMATEGQFHIFTCTFVH